MKNNKKLFVIKYKIIPKTKNLRHGSLDMDVIYKH